MGVAVQKPGLGLYEIEAAAGHHGGGGRSGEAVADFDVRG